MGMRTLRVAAISATEIASTNETSMPFTGPGQTGQAIGAVHSRGASTNSDTPSTKQV